MLPHSLSEKHEKSHLKLGSAGELQVAFPGHDHLFLFQVCTCARAIYTDRKNKKMTDDFRGFHPFLLCRFTNTRFQAYVFPKAMSLCRCYGNQLPTALETQIINLLPVYIGSQNTKQLQYGNLEAVELSPRSSELLTRQYKIHKLPLPWRVPLFT